MHVRDDLFVKQAICVHTFASAKGSLRWVTYRPTPTVWEKMNSIRLQSDRVSVPQQHTHDAYWHQFKVEWRRRFGDFDFGEGKVDQSGVTYEIKRWAIPHWAIALPLSLVATWLLLSSSQKPTKIIEMPV
jgi:hypothetical protein